MSDLRLDSTPSAEDLISRAKSIGSYIPSPDEAQKMAADLAEIATRKKGDKAELGGNQATAQETKQPLPTPDNRADIISEAYRRGLLPPDQKSLFEEAQRRGLVKGGTPPTYQSDTKSAGAVEPVEYQLPPFLQSLRESVHGQVGPLQGVDYVSGTDWADKVNLDRADDDREKYLYLSKKYGQGNVQRDPNGIFYVTIGGKKVAPGGGGFWARFSADVSAESPIFLGATAGAASASELGPLGMAAGAAAGGSAGKAAIEATKKLYGLSAKDLPETIGSIGKTGLEMGAGELGGSLVSRGVGRLTAGRVHPFIAGTSPESRRLSAITTEGGASPPIRSALPDMRVTQFHQALGEKLAGSFIEKRNLSFIEKEMYSLLKSSGMTDEEIPAAMKQILDPSSALSTAPLGTGLGSNIQAHAAGLGETAMAAQQMAQQVLDKQLAEIRLITRERIPSGRLGMDVADKFREARSDFSRAMQRAYSKIDDLVGDTPIVPTFLIKRRAASLLQKMPESDIKKIVKEIADMPAMESFENMQRLRTRLWELGEPADLAASGILKKDLRDLRTMADRSFEKIAVDETKPEGRQALNMLRAADKAYGEGIKKFEDSVLNQIVDAVKTGTAPDPSVVAKALLQSGRTERITEFKNLLGPDIWKRVVAQDWRDMLEVSSEKGEIDPMRFFREVMKRQRTGVLEAAYGIKGAPLIYQFARRNAVLGGKLPLSALDRGDSFLGAVEAAQQAQKNLEQFIDEHFLGELTNPSLPPELVYSTIVQPGKETLLERVFQHFAKDQPQIVAIRQTALKVLLKNAIVDTETGAGFTVGSDALKSALSKFTTKQQELLFPDGLSDDLNLVADMAKFLFPKGGGETVAGFAAGAIKAALPFGTAGSVMGFHGAGEAAWIAYAWGVTWGWVLSKPSVVRWLANGVRSRDTAVRKMTDETFRGIVRAGILGLLPGQLPEK